MEIDKAYVSLKDVLVKKGCKILSEEPSNQIYVRQGSLWGATPNSAKKKIQVKLAPADSGTKLTFSSCLTSDWKNITIIGCAFAALLVGVCLWMTVDLSLFMVSQKPSFWSWLVTVDGVADLQVVQAFINLTKILAVFLSVIIVFEAGVWFYVHAKIDVFAQEALNCLSSFK